MPEDCPFHPARDILVWPQRSTRAPFNQHLDVWKCPICDKVFFGEDKLASHYHSHGPLDQVVQQQQHSSEQKSTSRHAGHLTGLSASLGSSATEPHSSQSGNYVKRHISEGDRVCLGTFCDIMRCEVVERQLSEGPNSRGLPENNPEFPDEFKAAREACDPQAMATLESRCKLVMQQCTIGLLNVLSVKEYKDIEGELYRNICAYLRCERYWEVGPPETRTVSPLVASAIGFVFATVFFLCYYVVRVVSDYTPLPEEALPQELSNGTTFRRVSSSLTITRQHSAPLIGNVNYHKRYTAGRHHQQTTYEQRGSVLPPEVPLRHHYSHMHGRGHGYDRRDHQEQQHPTIRQLAQGHEIRQGQTYQGRQGSEIHTNNNNKHPSQQTGQYCSSAPLSVNQSSRFPNKRSPLPIKDIPKEFPSPVYHQPIKEYRALQMSPLHKEGSLGRRPLDYDRDETEEQMLYYSLDQHQQEGPQYHSMNQGQVLSHPFYATHHNIKASPSPPSTQSPFLAGQANATSYYDLGESMTNQQGSRLHQEIQPTVAVTAVAGRQTASRSHQMHQQPVHHVHQLTCQS
ncbi:uncharacterized protein LOC111250018 isoform X3 [Varroa destructor]|nr:uncharacterized protein LOC111250018 isoform X3 [Varroa destructor]